MPGLTPRTNVSNRLFPLHHPHLQTSESPASIKRARNPMPTPVVSAVPATPRCSGSCSPAAHGRRSPARPVTRNTDNPQPPRYPVLECQTIHTHQPTAVVILSGTSVATRPNASSRRDPSMQPASPGATPPRAAATTSGRTFQRRVKWRNRSPQQRQPRSMVSLPATLSSPKRPSSNQSRSHYLVKARGRTTKKKSPNINQE
jgi:hypothetical protein